jgi:hypothetical protein
MMGYPPHDTVVHPEPREDIDAVDRTDPETVEADSRWPIQPTQHELYPISHKSPETLTHGANTSPPGYPSYAGISFWYASGRLFGSRARRTRRGIACRSVRDGRIHGLLLRGCVHRAFTAQIIELLTVG